MGLAAVGEVSTVTDKVLPNDIKDTTSSPS